LSDPDGRMAWMIVLGTLPIVVCGLLFKKHIETTLRGIEIIAEALIVLALLMIVAEELVRARLRARTPQKDLASIGWLEAFFIGVCQAAALVPGTSRSGSTITGGLFLGLSRETAARFSFLLSLPAIFAAAVLELFDQREHLLDIGMANLILSTAVSGVVGYLAIAFLMRYLRTRTLYLFIAYRLLLAASLLALLAAGRLTA
jgi:undecaprenyl-diphosphatase